MAYTLGQAAKATGLSKPTLSDAIKKGRISASKDDFGRYQIDPAELHRVYPPLSKADRQEDPQDGRNKTPELDAKIRVLEAQLQAMAELKAQIADERDDLRADRDHWREEAAQIRRMLTDQNAKPAPEPTPGFWKRLFRNG